MKMIRRSLAIALVFYLPGCAISTVEPGVTTTPSEFTVTGSSPSTESVIQIQQNNPIALCCLLYNTGLINFQSRGDNHKKVNHFDQPLFQILKAPETHIISLFFAFSVLKSTLKILRRFISVNPARKRQIPTGICRFQLSPPLRVGEILLCNVKYACGV